MGKVYLAEVLEPAAGLEPGSKVALKVVHPHLLATPGFFKRFMQEAHLGKMVRHENVVRTYDVDATLVQGETCHYMVMEYVEGRDLRQLLLDLGSIPEALLREIALQTAAGLCAIHAAGVVHRDLKPENILITDDHRVRVMDLGVAKLQEASISITKEGQFAGSVLYAAPEQFGGGEVGAASDLYALGIMLLELATGKHPIDQQRAGAVIKAHLEEVPPRASDLNPDISPFLTELLATLLQKKPEDRLESAEALRMVLEEGEKSSWWRERESRLRRDEGRLPKIPVARDAELHGREDDLEQLQKAWAMALEGRGNTVLIEGEAGIGKTRLADAFMKTLEAEEFDVLYGCYPPSGGMGGLSDAIVGKFGEAQLEDALRPYLTVTPMLIPAFAALLRRESPPTGAEPISSEGLQAVSVHLMRALAEERPVLWVMDDLHFAPGVSRDLILALARAVEGHRALLVVTTRPGPDLAPFSRLDNYRRIAVGRLSPREVIRLLEDALKSELLADKLGAKIAKKSDGVPFFIFEMIRDLREGGFIKRQEDGSYVQTQVVTEIDVPSAVKDLIHHRLRDLTEEQRAILDAGAVQGVSFEAGLIAEVLEMKRVVVLRALAEIERRFGLVHGEATTCRFDQNQVHEVLYTDLLPELRAEYHTLLADACGRRCGDDPKGEEAFQLAFHHLRGSRPKSGLPFLEAALEHLDEGYRNEAAVDLSERALSIEGLLAGKQRAEILLKKAVRFDILGRRDEAREVFDEAIAIADGERDLKLGSRARWRLGYMVGEMGRFEEAQPILEEAAALARQAGDREYEAVATGALGGVFHRADRYEEAAELQERYRNLARELGLVRDEGIATGNLGLVFWDMGRYDDAIENFKRARELSRRSGSRVSEAIVEGNMGIALVDIGRFKEAQEHQERSRELSRAIGHRYGESLAVGNLGTVFLDTGRYEQAQKQFEQHLELSREIGDRGGESLAMVNLVLVLTLTGRLEEAAEEARHALARMRDTGEVSIKGYALCALGDVLEAGGERAEATSLYEEALQLFREIGRSKSVADALCSLGRVLAADGDEEAAIRHLDEAAVLARELKLPGTELLAGGRRALLEGGNPQPVMKKLVAQDALIPHSTKIETRFCLWKATQDRAHLEEAHRLLMDVRANSPEEYRDSMLQDVPLHRDIVAAWNEHVA